MPPTPTSRKAVLGTLIFGFSLVMALLLAAGAVAFQNTKLIRTTAADLAREQALTARLIDEIQREHSFVNHLLARLRGSKKHPRKDLLNELGEVDRRFNELVKQADSLGVANQWAEPAAAASAFVKEARRVLASPDLESADVEMLWSRHEELLAQVVRLVELSSTRVAGVEAQLEKHSHSINRQSFILIGSSLVAAFACAVMTIWLVGRAFTRLTDQERELARVSFHLLQSQERSAQRFSHELHDEMGQVLSAFKANLITMDPSNLDERRRDCLQLADQALASVREMSQLLRPVILDDFGLDAALGWLSERFSARTGIAVEYKSEGASRLPGETETHLFRIAQEALTNVARHSGAKKVNIRFEQSARRAILRIEDDGRGLPPKGNSTVSLGMTGMRARARHLGGELELRSKPGQGLTVETRVPIQESRT